MNTTNKIQVGLYKISMNPFGLLPITCAPLFVCGFPSPLPRTFDTPPIVIQNCASIDPIRSVTLYETIGSRFNSSAFGSAPAKIRNDGSCNVMQAGEADAPGNPVLR
jgi:hypothetical protein